METFAIVQIAGKQYKVTSGSKLVVDNLGTREGKVTFDNVLLVASDGDIKIGNPTVSGAQVVATVLGGERGDKITVVKFKAKARYRRKTGFRSKLSQIQVDEIRVGDKTSKETTRVKKESSDKKRSTKK